MIIILICSHMFSYVLIIIIISPETVVFADKEDRGASCRFSRSQLELPGHIERIPHYGTPQPCQMGTDLMRAAWH
jgi:hypothetical protein